MSYFLLKSICNFDEARSVSIDIAYFDKEYPEDEERIEYEEIY